MPKAFDKTPKITYPPGCKDLSEELSKDELVRRLKVRNNFIVFQTIVCVVLNLFSGGKLHVCVCVLIACP